MAIKRPGPDGFHNVLLSSPRSAERPPFFAGAKASKKPVLQRKMQSELGEEPVSAKQSS